ncbi:hypothetical protein ACEYX6_07615 [Acinetobacter sp. c2-A9]|uniref:hypothetical protein n=1 Tax=Acinetobacter sp. c2-A9 TaxID=3342802 RepID=UPI0035B7FCE3
MFKFSKNGLLLAMGLASTACALTYPYDWASYRLNNKNPAFDDVLKSKIQRDMLACGFKSINYNQRTMSQDEIAKASICMDSKGYQSDLHAQTRQYPRYHNLAICKNN